MDYAYYYKKKKSVIKVVGINVFYDCMEDKSKLENYLKNYWILK